MQHLARPFRIKQVETEEEFKAYFALRWRLLRKPWRQEKGSEQDDIEAQCYHLMAIDSKNIDTENVDTENINSNNKIIGVARLQFNTGREAQIRYMAVDVNNQQQGIGRALIENIETHANSLGIDLIVLDAREPAVVFYQRLGYRIEKRSYLLFGEIQHFRMTKKLSS